MSNRRIEAAAGSCLFSLVGGVLGASVGVYLGAEYLQDPKIGGVIVLMGIAGVFAAVGILCLFVAMGSVVGAALGGAFGAFVATWEPQSSKKARQSDTGQEPMPSADVESPEEEIARLQREITELENERAILEGENNPES
jgi:membrane protein YqaA with SNARE-associated domain